MDKREHDQRDPRGSRQQWMLVRVLVAFAIVMALLPAVGGSWAAAQDAATPPAETIPADQTGAVATETPTPTEVPTETPTEAPSEAPTEIAPTDMPTELPTGVPTDTPTPTVEPTDTPTPAEVPTQTATDAPSVTAADVAAPAAAPWIASDKDDYPPGGLVTLTGGNWQPGETVHIFVNDDEGQSWSRNVDIVADENGQFTDTFNLPDRFVANYSVKATGAASGVATTAFTDSANDGIAYSVSRVPASGSQSVAAGSTFDTPSIGISKAGSSNEQVKLPITVGDPSTTACGGGTAIPDTWMSVSSGTLPANISGGSTPFSFRVSVPSAAAPGAYVGKIRLTVTSGDLVNAGFDLCLNVTAVSRTTTTTLSRSPNAATTYGDSITFTASITAPGGDPNGAGTVSFTDGSTTLCANAALTGNGASCTLSTLSVASHSITAAYSGTSSGNPQFGSSTSSALSHTVNQKSVTGSFTANNKVYDTATTATIATRSLSGAVAGDDVSLTGGSAVFADKNAGTAKTVNGSGFSLAGAKAANYSLASTTLTAAADITAKSIAGSFTASNKAYDGATAAAILIRSLSGVLGTDAVTISGGSATFADANAGTSKTVAGSGFALAGGEAGNYSLSSVANATADITTRPIAVAADAKTKQFGAPEPSLTYQVTSGSLVTGEAFTGALNRAPGEAVGAYAVLQNTLSAGTNYALTYTGANLVITSRPVVLAADNATVNVSEGQTALNTGTVSDPGVPVTLSASPGTIVQNANGTWSWSFITNDGSSQSQTVTITAMYSGGPSSTTFQLTVANIAPTATLGNNGPVNEGSPATVSFTAQSDPSSADTTAGFHYAYSCTNGDLSTATYAGSGSVASAPCTFADGPATLPVRARIIDKDGGFTEYTTAVTVNNVTPAVTQASSQSAAAGAPTLFNLGSFTDPGADNPWSISVNWGDASAATTFDQAMAGTITAQTHTYAAGGTFTVSVTVKDKDQAVSTPAATFTVMVAASISLTISSGTVDLGAFSPSGGGAGSDFQSPSVVTVTVDSSNPNWTGQCSAASSTGGSGIQASALAWKVTGNDGSSTTTYAAFSSSDCFSSHSAGQRSYTYDYQIHVNWTDAPGDFHTVVTYQVTAG